MSIFIAIIYNNVQLSLTVRVTLFQVCRVFCMTNEAFACSPYCQSVYLQYTPDQKSVTVYPSSYGSK